MLTITGLARIFICKHPINMLKSFEGLSSEIEQNFPEVPTSGAYFVFLNRRRDRMKVLYWDTDGLAIWYKRLEKGTFSPNKNHENLLTRRDFFLLLEGITPKRLQRRYNIS